MRRTQFLLLCGLLFSVLPACQENPMEDCEPVVPTASSLTILPLGDSRVEGASPEFESYRYTLWSLLINAGWDIDFIGSQTDRGAYSPVNRLCFDLDHEGTGGAQTSDILETITQKTFVPDVVLLGIGGNDLLEGGLTVSAVIVNIRQIIEKIRLQNPSAIIFVEQIAPARSDIMTEELQMLIPEYAAALTEIAADLGQPASPIIVVNMSDGWSDDYMADDVHYNLAGAQEVARRYFAAMDLHIER